MKKPLDDDADEMKPHYDIPWNKATRGKYANRIPRDVFFVPIDPALRAHFPTADAINDALRSLVQSAEKTSTKKRRIATPKKKLRSLH